MQYRLTVETEYISWQDPTTQALSNEMYPTITYQCAAVTFKGNVPNQLGKIYAEVECHSLVRDAMHADPRLEVVGEVLLDEGLETPQTLTLTEN